MSEIEKASGDTIIKNDPGTTFTQTIGSGEDARRLFPTNYTNTNPKYEDELATRAKIGPLAEKLFKGDSSGTKKFYDYILTQEKNLELAKYHQWLLNNTDPNSPEQMKRIRESAPDIFNQMKKRINEKLESIKKYAFLKIEGPKTGDDDRFLYSIANGSIDEPNIEFLFDDSVSKINGPDGIVSRNPSHNLKGFNFGTLIDESNKQSLFLPNNGDISGSFFSRIVKGSKTNNPYGEGYSFGPTSLQGIVKSLNTDNKKKSIIKMIETFILERIEEKVIELTALIVSDLLIYKEKSLESIDTDEQKRSFANKLCDVLVISFRCQPPDNFIIFCDYEKTKNSIKSLYDKSIEEHGHYEVFSKINQIFNDETIREHFSNESFKEVESVLLKNLNARKEIIENISVDPLGLKNGWLKYIETIKEFISNGVNDEYKQNFYELSKDLKNIFSILIPN
ncbi:hypothetical protein ACTA71_005977 [Dictyostelium dimigraforme]